jgi:hypothetical protein
LLLLDVTLPGRYTDAGDKKKKSKLRAVRLLLFNDSMIWCKAEVRAYVYDGF